MSFEITQQHQRTSYSLPCDETIIDDKVVNYSPGNGGSLLNTRIINGLVYSYSNASGQAYLYNKHDGFTNDQQISLVTPLPYDTGISMSYGVDMYRTALYGGKLYAAPDAGSDVSVSYLLYWCVKDSKFKKTATFPAAIWISSFAVSYDGQKIMVTGSATSLSSSAAIGKSYYSNDGGESWSTTDSTAFGTSTGHGEVIYTYDPINNREYFVYSSKGGIFRTSSTLPGNPLGAKWTYVSPSSSVVGNYSGLIEIGPPSAQKVLISSSTYQDVVYVSIDYGATWTTVSVTGINDIRCFAWSENTGEIIAVSYGGYVGTPDANSYNAKIARTTIRFNKTGIPHINGTSVFSSLPTSGWWTVQSLPTVRKDLFSVVWFNGVFVLCGIQGHAYLYNDLSSATETQDFYSYGKLNDFTYGSSLHAARSIGKINRDLKYLTVINYNVMGTLHPGPRDWSWAWTANSISYTDSAPVGMNATTLAIPSGVDFTYIGCVPQSGANGTSTIYKREGATLSALGSFDVNTRVYHVACSHSGQYVGVLGVNDNWQKVFHYSSDYGVTWTRNNFDIDTNNTNLPSPTQGKLMFVPGYGWWYYAPTHGVYRSYDNGVTWVKVYTSYDNTGLVRGMISLGGAVVLVVTGNKIAYTIDAGSNWTTITITDHYTAPAGLSEWRIVDAAYNPITQRLLFIHNETDVNGTPSCIFAKWIPDDGWNSAQLQAPASWTVVKNQAAQSGVGYIPYNSNTLVKLIQCLWIAPTVENSDDAGAFIVVSGDSGSSLNYYNVHIKKDKTYYTSTNLVEPWYHMTGLGFQYRTGSMTTASYYDYRKTVYGVSSPNNVWGSDSVDSWTKVSLGPISGDIDNGVWTNPISLGFTWGYNGSNYTSYRLSTNGRLDFAGFNNAQTLSSSTTAIVADNQDNFFDFYSTFTGRLYTDGVDGRGCFYYTKKVSASELNSKYGITLTNYPSYGSTYWVYANGVGKVMKITGFYGSNDQYYPLNNPVVVELMDVSSKTISFAGETIPWSVGAFEIEYIKPLVAPKPFVVNAMGAGVTHSAWIGNKSWIDNGVQHNIHRLVVYHGRSGNDKITGQMKCYRVTLYKAGASQRFSVAGVPYGNYRGSPTAGPWPAVALGAANQYSTSSYEISWKSDDNGATWSSPGWAPCTVAQVATPIASEIQNIVSSNYTSKLVLDPARFDQGEFYPATVPSLPAANNLPTSNPTLAAGKNLYSLIYKYINYYNGKVTSAQNEYELALLQCLRNSYQRYVSGGKSGGYYITVYYADITKGGVVDSVDITDAYRMGNGLDPLYSNSYDGVQLLLNQINLQSQDVIAYASNAGYIVSNKSSMYSMYNLSKYYFSGTSARYNISARNLINNTGAVASKDLTNMLSTVNIQAPSVYIYGSYARIG